jgi:hypothetical protein
MKKIFTLLFSMIFLAASAGYAYQNKLTISSTHKSLLKVQIDGRFYQLGNKEAEISLTDLRPGTRSIKVYQQRSNGRGWQGSNERNMELLYNGRFTIREGYHVDISINRFGNAFVDERAISRNYNADDDDDRTGYGDQNNWNRQPMNDRSFMQLKQTISRESFDDGKINIAKVAIANTYLTSNQVKDLLSLYNFENSKLDLAKYCYRFAIDPGNYYVVADALTYSTSKNDLMKYIQQNR